MYIKETGSSNGFSVQLFRIFEIIMFCFVAAISDLVHDDDAIIHCP